MSLNMLIEFGYAFDYSGADFRRLVRGAGWLGEVGRKTTPRVFGGKSPLRQQRRAQPARGTMSKVPSRPRYDRKLWIVEPVTPAAYPPA